MRLPSPQQPDQRGVADGRPYWLWLPRTPSPWPGMVILHGAGSCKENHGDFGRLCASSGWAAIAYDQRGHGEALDQMGAAAIGDVGRMAAVLGAAEGVDERIICARGSSMGGWMAIHAAAVSERIAAAVAICPADEDVLRRGLRGGELQMRSDVEAMVAWLGEHDVREAAAQMGTKPLILLHAMGDERVPYLTSEQIYERKPDPRKLVILPGGHHRSIQHDGEMQGMALRWIDRALRGRARDGALRPF